MTEAADPLAWHPASPRLRPVALPAPRRPVIGAEDLHEILAGWRAHLQPGEYLRGRIPVEPSGGGPG